MVGMEQKLGLFRALCRHWTAWPVSALMPVLFVYEIEERGTQQKGAQ